MHCFVLEIVAGGSTERKAIFVSEQFHVKELSNGVTLVGQSMENVSSAAMTIQVRAGSSRDADGLGGTASVATEWALRGAGARDTRQLNDALDALGCQHHESVRSEHVVFSASQLGRNLHDVLAIYADILLRPRLDDETFGPCLALAVQDLASLEDEPARKCSLMLRERFYPFPLGRSPLGSTESLGALTPEAVREHVSSTFSPAGAILSVAGNIQWDAFCADAESLLGDWSVPAPPAPSLTPPAGGTKHVAKDSAQCHIALAHAAWPVADDMHFAARMARTVLSAGMSSRLFTEVREKRGLAYHVGTTYHSLKHHAGMFTYAGTVPEKAQETFDVTVGEIRRLGDGISGDELARAKTQLKSSLVRQGESTGARAEALASGWYHLNRLRSLEELSHEIDTVTVDDVLAYLHDYPAADLVVLVIGPEPVDVGAQDSE